MSQRSAFTLLELMLALASASVLMVGLSSALFIASQGLDLDQGASASLVRSGVAVGRLLADARTATRFRSVTSTAMEFDVADRTGDGAVDRLRYAWDGAAGGPLTRTINGGSPVTLLRDVRSLSFAAPIRAVAAPNVTSTPLRTWPAFRAGDAPIYIKDINSIGITQPASLVPGDLVIAIVGIEKDHTGDMSSSPGWTQLVREHKDDTVTLGVWCRTYAVGDPNVFYCWWSGDKDVMGWMVTFSNHHPTTPVAATEVATLTGDLASPTVPSVTAATANSCLLRVGAFEADKFDVVDVTGLVGHTDVWARNGSGHISVACGYIPSVAAGPTGAASFVLKDKRKFVTASILITPRPPVGQ